MLDGTSLMINEFLAANGNGLPDEDGDSPDWIEIYNAGDSQVDLDGWSLTDDANNLQQWQFPAVALSPDEYLVVFASGKNRSTAGSQLHTNFQLASEGEYLALIEPDGATVAHEYAPEFPRQFQNISYGIGGDSSDFAFRSGSSLTYWVPQDDSLGANWTGPGFDDSTWTSFATAPSVLITEAGTGSPDYIEIQNVAGSIADTSGWIVAANNAMNVDINEVHSVLWTLPDSLDPGELLTRVDTAGDDIFWIAGAEGWVMILDGQGKIVDFVVWGYDAADLATMEVDVGTFENIRVTEVWNGAPVSSDAAPTESLQRVGSFDDDDASNWTFANAPSENQANQGLDLPFTADISPGIGFDTAGAGIGDPIQTDIGPQMDGVNASVFLRFPFEAATPSVLDWLTLKIKHNDGFVAFINGQEVARRSAPVSPTWDSTATASRSAAESLQTENIDISQHLGLVQPGVNVLAIHGLNAAIDDGTFLIEPDFFGGAIRYFETPSPGEANGFPRYLDYVRDTTFTVDRGFYTDPFDATISTATPGAAIYYTTDGSAPSETNGTLYAGPVHITTTTTLRAAAFFPGYLPTNVDTHTYIFLDDVIQQDGAGYPDPWGLHVWGDEFGQPVQANYEMDPEVVGDPRYSTTIKDDLRSVPTMSLVFDPADLWDEQTGIYTNPTLEGINWERPVSVEMIDGDGQTLFQVDAGGRIHGRSGRYPDNSVKHSFRLLFKSDYGPTKLDYPLFGQDATDSFDTVVLRSDVLDTWATDWWVEQDSESTYIQDQWVAAAQNDMGSYAPHGTWVHLYVNGLYWGLYDPVERPDGAFAASYFGGDKDEYDVLHTWELKQGNLNSWNELLDLVAQPSIDYAAVQELLDVPDFVDYMIANQFAGNIDWPTSNWIATHRRVPGAKWHFHTWDAEFSLLHLDDNRLYEEPYWADGPGDIYLKLSAVEEFRMLYADRIYQHMFNDGALTLTHNLQRMNTLADTLDRAIVGESARWGDGRLDEFSPPRTRDDDWLPRINWLRDTYFPQRTNIVLQQYRDAGLYPSIDVPSFNQQGGQVAPGFELTITAPGSTIYYTLDGSDPRDPAAVVYSGPITLAENTLVKSRAQSGAEWSALNEAQFITHQPANAANFAITELNYHPYDRTADEIAAGFLDDDDFEFVELKNIGPTSIDLFGVRFIDGIDFDFTGGPITRLDPGQFVLIVSNTTAFAYRYGSLADVAGQYTGRLGNGGERIALLDVFDQTIRDFTYGDSKNTGWPNRADGNGPTLEALDPAGDLSDPDNWRSSGELLGTPGSTGTGPFEGVVVNEVLTHTDYPLVDAIELYNWTDAEIPIGGWWLSDDNDDFQKFQVPAGTTIPAYGYVTFYEGHYLGRTLMFDPVNEFGGLGGKDFALSGARGDDVWLLVDPAGGALRFADHVEFGSAFKGESFGRWPDSNGDLYPMTARTLGGPNSGPRIGPDLLISEVMYNAPEVPGILPENLEFIEIYNITSQPIDLTGWRLRKGFDFDFAPGTMIGSREALVIVAFNPSDAIRLADFRSYYGIGAEVPIVGTFGDRLDDAGEQIQLQRPDTPPTNDPLYVPHPLEDQIEYLSTWYTDTNGNGRSLNRAGLNLWGNDSTSFSPEDPTPGTAEQLDTTVITGRHVFYNDSAFGNTIASDKTALRPGEQATFANYTSYAKGINGIIIDVAGLANPGGIDEGDFTFKIGNDDTPANWTDAPALPNINATTSQIILTWPDGVIHNTWIEVTVLATVNTGLAAPDVFYFGNAPGETGDSLIDAKVDAIDVLATRQNPRPFFDPPTIDNVYDFNRDRRVDAIDTLIARNNQTWSGTELELLDLTAAKGAVVNSEAKSAGQARPLNGEFEKVLNDSKDWLHQFEQISKKDRPSRNKDPLAHAVDRLLATIEQ